MVLNAIRFLWSRVDAVIRLLAGIKDLEGSKIWRVALRRYRGQSRRLADGTIVKKGDRLLELHLNNDFLSGMARDTASPEGIAVKAAKEVAHSLSRLARLLKEDNRYQKVKAVFGITILNRPVRRFGFEVYDLEPGALTALTRFYEKMILSIYHPWGPGALKNYRRSVMSKYVIMSKNELIRRYLPGDGKGTG